MSPDNLSTVPFHHLPKWLADDIGDMQAHLSPDARQNFDEFLTEYLRIIDLFQQLPQQTKLYELRRITPDSLTRVYGHVFSGLAHACEALIGYWAFQHAHKFKASLSGFRYSFEEGNFILAFSCARTMFEELAHFHLFLIRLEAGQKKVADLYQKGPKRRKRPSPEWERKFFEVRLEIVQCLIESREGSDYNWKGWYKDALRNQGASETDIERAIESHRDFRKTHINDGIKSITKTSKYNAARTYDLLSEMVHPNFGSNTLIVVTRTCIDDLRGDAVLSDTPRNIEAAAWFFELASGPLKEIFSLEVDCMKRSQQLLRYYQADALLYESSPDP